MCKHIVTSLPCVTLQHDHHGHKSPCINTWNCVFLQGVCRWALRGIEHDCDHGSSIVSSDHRWTGWQSVLHRPKVYCLPQVRVVRDGRAFSVCLESTVLYVWHECLCERDPRTLPHFYHTRAVRNQGKQEGGFNRHHLLPSSWAPSQRNLQC